MRKVTVLGSTGSVGRQALDVIREFPGRLRVHGLAAGGNVEMLADQAAEFRPEFVALRDEGGADRLRERIGGLAEILVGEEGVCELAGGREADVVVSAISGFAGLSATVQACEAGAILALANKESVVCGGKFLMDRIRRRGVTLIPVDSEHNALFQCLTGEDPGDVDRLILTASGGPLYGAGPEELSAVTPEQALAHPRWDMGNKISIDSATLMNKGLEVIEAHWLFGIPLDRIEVLVHPQSAVHSLVRFRDGSMKAQVGATDMRYPIQYALSYPQRWEDPGYAEFSLAGETLAFAQPDVQTFPCLALALRAGRAGGIFPTVLVAADEVAVEAFLARRLRFTGIPRVIDEVLNRVPGRLRGEFPPGPGEILDANDWARSFARDIVQQVGREEIH
ncbi:MAG: 1-deoxy-D-xylulose-5-phosphate reductoisomerase [Bacillota bacterium]